MQDKFSFPMIDINSREHFFSLLAKLSDKAVPTFGKLGPQHMVEHLYDTVMLSNGKCPVRLYGSEVKAAIMKRNLIYSDEKFPMEFKAPMMGDQPPELRFPDLKTAIENLKSELDDFDTYFFLNKSARTMNPILGELDKDEWTVFHNKHFTHHLQQYNLI